MFDFYDGGGLDLTCVGLAQVDRDGNVNVSKIGVKIIGCGGFINITQASKEIIFCGEFTAAGTQIEVKDGQVRVVAEGKVPKFVRQVEQITFSGKAARQDGRKVLFVTERCVFRLVPEGLMLIELAPGIDLQKDVLESHGLSAVDRADLKPMDPHIFRDEPMGVFSHLA